MGDSVTFYYSVNLEKVLKVMGTENVIGKKRDENKPDSTEHEQYA